MKLVLTLLALLGGLLAAPAAVPGASARPVAAQWTATIAAVKAVDAERRNVAAFQPAPTPAATRRTRALLLPMDFALPAASIPPRGVRSRE